MYSLSDCFAYMYAVDLHTLDLIIDEAIRILAERWRDPEPLAAGVSTVATPRFR
jgi:hypothetical protein